MHWLHVLWYNYGWPSDQGNGPEAVQEIVITAIVASLFIPRVRRWWQRHIKSIHDKLDAHHKEQMEQAQSHHKAALAQAQKHHELHMAAIASAAPVKKAVKKQPAKKVK